MPAAPPRRQPDDLAWFETRHGQAVLAAECLVLRQALLSRPVQTPWLWIAATAQGAGHGLPLPPRSVLLHRQGRQLAGALRCGQALPLPSESVGNLIVQHAVDDGGHALLEECVRVLQPGGRLWLFTLNPCSPYRLHWRGTTLQARAPSVWQRRLRHLGMTLAGAQVAWLGPLWRPDAPDSPARRLRAACLLEGEKRSVALIPPATVKRQWRAGAATA